MKYIKKTSRDLLLLFSLSLVTVFSTPHIAMAVDEAFYSGNNVEFSNPDDTCQPTSGGISTTSVPIEQKIAETFIVGFNPNDTAKIRSLVEKHKLGGVFFVGDGDNLKLTKAYFDELNKTNGSNLFIAADDEGGQVARFTKGTTPSAKAMGQMTPAQVEAEGKKAGELLVASGLNGDLAPVVDLETSGTPWSQMERNFSNNSADVISKAGAFAKGLKSVGIAPVYKHFPGIGKVKENTDAQPSTPQRLSQIGDDLLPYYSLVNQHGGSVMLSNGYIEEWDSNIPVSINPKAVEYLRTDLKFSGVIMTDALEVLETNYASKGVDTPTAVARALNAGVDMPLFVLRNDAVIQQAIDKVKADVSVEKINKAYEKSKSFRSGQDVSAADKAASNSNASCCLQNASSVSVTLEGKDNIEKVLNFFMQKGLTLAQASGFIGNMQQESGVNPKAVQPSTTTDDPNYKPVSGKGFGLVQWTFPERQDPLVEHMKSYGSMLDLGGQLEFVWKELQSNQFNKGLKLLQTETDPVEAAVTIHGRKGSNIRGPQDQGYRGYEESGDSAEAVKSVRGGFAKQIYDKYSDAAPLTPTARVVSADLTKASASAGCASATGDGAASGNIAQTALNLAWPNRGVHKGLGKETARDTYQIAMPKYNNYTDTTPWTDCGVFTATVMRASGADPEYAGRGTSVQLDYIQSNPKFSTFVPSDTSQLRPGMVAIVRGTNGVGHTYIYTGPYKGDDGKEYDIAQASLGSHVPEGGNVLLSDSRGLYTFGEIVAK